MPGFLFKRATAMIVKYQTLIHINLLPPKVIVRDHKMNEFVHHINKILIFQLCLRLYTCTFGAIIFIQVSSAMRVFQEKIETNEYVCMHESIYDV